MKKSQVLATLALAFALGLGVVAPVANTYAQITPNTATDAQKNAIYEEANEVIELAGDLENVDAYKTLYSSVEDLVKGLDKISAAELRLFNENMAHGQENINSTNYYIAQATKLIGTTSSKLYASTTVDGKKVYTYIKDGVDFADAQLQTISVFTKVNTLKEAYNAAVAARDAAASNVEILQKNYKWNGQTEEPAVVNNAIKWYSNAESNINSWLNDLGAHFAAGQYYDFDAAGTTADPKLKNAYENTVPTPSSLAGTIKTISTDAYTALTTNKDWVATPTGAKVAVDYGLVINAAKALPKYNYVKAVMDAETNVLKITADDKNVDYTKAQEYIAALKTAISNYEKGVAAPVTRDLTVTAAGTTVTATGAFPAGVELKIAKSDNKVAAFGDYAYKMWNITLVKDGKEVSFEGNVTVTITVPEGIKGEKAGVYFVDKEGNTQRYASTYKDGKLTFTTKHFSLWAIVEDNGKVLDTPKAPTTGIVNTEGNASTTVAMVAGLATALTAAGAGVVAYRNARRSTRK